MESRTMKSKDIISVIISAYNSEKTITKTLRSLEEQDLDKNLYEVIISDDGSRDSTKAIVESFIQRGKMNIFYCFQENEGVGSARNKGVSNSVGKILAFTDADCICDQNWLSVVYQKIAKDGHDFIGGYTYSNDTIIFPWKMAPVEQSGITANLAISFKDLEVPLFDSGFTGMLGDDTDFVLRMEEEGMTLVFTPEMRVLHPPNIIGLDRIIIRARGRQNEVGLYKKHREKVLSSFSLIFRPILFGRISLFSISTIFGITTLGYIYSVFGSISILIIFLLFFILFHLYLYKYFVIYNPDNRRILMKDRTKTFVYFLVITPLFFYYRIIGMIKFKFFML